MNTIHQTKYKDGKIFVLWFQGENKAPELVKLCISSIKRNCNGHEVIILNKNNLFNWIKPFPKRIMKKFENGIFSLQLESDLIRYSLLAKYNCLWLDSTVYVSQPISDQIFEKEFYTVIRRESLRTDITGKISPFIMGRGKSKRSEKVFEFCKDLLNKYILNEDDLINYLLVENIFYIAVCHNLWLENLLNYYFKHKTNVLKLANKLNDIYCQNDLENLLVNNTFNKLNFHDKTLLKWKNNKMTNYEYLLKREKNEVLNHSTRV